MGVCLGFDTALRYWLTKRAGEEAPCPAESGSFGAVESGSRVVRAAGLPLEGTPQRPLHLVVPNDSLKRSCVSAVTHVCTTELPRGSFRRLGGDNLVASPELTFLQMAQRRPLWDLIEIGCYLCSTFAIDEVGRDYTGKREQLLTYERLARYLDELPPQTYGARRARRALGYVVEATASPMEVQLVMHYGLPPELGGRGPIRIVANQLIRIDEHAQRLLGSRYLVGDLCMPEYGCDLEYDSELFHTGCYRLDHTQARRNVLEAMHVKTISATHGQICTPRMFDDFTWLFEERVGREHPTYDWHERSLQLELYEWLNDPHRTLF